jgi:hypothetical protein
MPAELVELQAALGRMGMEPAVTTLITDAQGLETLEEFTHLTDTEVENLCKVIRRPGGLYPTLKLVQQGNHQPSMILDMPYH